MDPKTIAKQSTCNVSIIGNNQPVSVDYSRTAAESGRACKVFKMPFKRYPLYPSLIVIPRVADEPATDDDAYP